MKSNNNMPETGAVSQTENNLNENNVAEPEKLNETEVAVLAEPKVEESVLAVNALMEPKPETEGEIEAPKKRKRKKTAEPETQKEAQSEDAEESPVVVSMAVDEIKKLSKQATKKKEKIVAIGETRSVETDADKSKNDLLDLIESLRIGRILTGTVEGVERTVDSSVAVIYHGEFKVIIPATEMIDNLTESKELEPEDVHHLLLTKRLGAEVDYVIKGIDSDAGVAVASRLDAMKAKRKEYYLSTDREGNNLMYPGVCAEARVVSVIRAGIFAEIFGVETYIPLRELSYQRMMDAAGYFQTGQRILVKLIEVNREDKHNITVTASVKQASENPYEKALRKYTVGNRYVGSVSMVDTNGVFVALDGGIDCLCSYPKRGRPPRGARVTVRILGINHETNRIWGAITHTALPR